MYNAERQGWEVKDNNIRNIESSLGSIRFSRRYYSKIPTNGHRVYTYLLNDVLGLEKFNMILDALITNAVEKEKTKGIQKLNE